MKTTFKRTNVASKTYKKGDALQPDSFYEDGDGALVITDCEGVPVAVLMCNEAFPIRFIGWPLKDTAISEVTISR